MIDALLSAARRDIPIGIELDSAKRLVLITAHRRDSFGAPLRWICQAVEVLHATFDDVEFLWPVHPNPSVRPVVEELMTGFPRVHLCRPLAYGPFVSAMKRATIILTDSGGIQEEAPRSADRSWSCGTKASVPRRSRPASPAWWARMSRRSYRPRPGFSSTPSRTNRWREARALTATATPRP